MHGGKHKYTTHLTRDPDDYSKHYEEHESTHDAVDNAMTAALVSGAHSMWYSSSDCAVACCHGVTCEDCI